MRYVKQKLENLIDVTDIITIHYFEFSKDFVFPAEKHNFWELHYVDKGSVYSVSDDTTVKLKQGEIIFHKPMSKHQILIDKTNVPNVCVISFSCNSLAMKFFESKTFLLNPEQRFILKSFLNEAYTTFHLPQMLPTLNKLAKKNNPPFACLQMLKIKLETLLIDIYRNKNADIKSTPFLTFNEEYDDELTNQIVTYLANNLSEDISLDDLCKRFNYSKTHLCNHFKKITGKSLFNYLAELKINVAKYMIRKSNSNYGFYANIADQLGFHSSSHFFHQFKKITGMTPTQYSQSVKQYDTKKNG